MQRTSFHDNFSVVFRYYVNFLIIITIFNLLIFINRYLFYKQYFWFNRIKSKHNIIAIA